MRSLSLIFSCLMFASQQAHGAEFLWGQRPVLRYSDVWCGEQNSKLLGYFDISYFNAELPRGSELTVHYGFEEVSSPRSSSRESIEPDQWLDKGSVSMKQWEEFGWYARVARQVTTRFSHRRISALKVYFEILLPDGRRVFSLGEGDETRPKAYFFGAVPDMRTCRDLGHERLKICAMPVTVVQSP